ncbi:MAG: collagen-like protein [Verrucomicrobia bacterium]|nr:collagen-like protein [Verrucomicrobiota bacterium]
MNSFSLSAPRALLALTALSLAAVAPKAHAQAQSLLSSNQVVVTRVEPILPDGLLITGINFGKTTPTVSLYLPGSKSIAVLNTKFAAGSAEIVATLPAGTTATAPGTYRLMVSFGPGTAATDVFEFTIGAVGLTGAQGIQGIQGVKGDKGDQGIQGVKGDKGDQGLQGIQGVKGDKGDQGIQGVKGDQGVQGPKGDKGDQGIQGVQGAQGDKGDRGEKGEKGETGAVGPQGAQGVQGATGVTGLDALPIFQNKPAAIAAGLKVGQFWIQASNGQVYRLMDLNGGN